MIRGSRPAQLENDQRLQKHLWSGQETRKHLELCQWVCCRIVYQRPQPVYREIFSLSRPLNKKNEDSSVQCWSQSEATDSKNTRECIRDFVTRPSPPSVVYSDYTLWCKPLSFLGNFIDYADPLREQIPDHIRARSHTQLQEILPKDFKINSKAK